MTPTADLMFLNDLPSVVTFGQIFGAITAKFMQTHIATQWACNIQWIIIWYARTGFVVQTFLIDMKLIKVIPELPETVIAKYIQVKYNHDVKEWSEK